MQDDRVADGPRRYDHDGGDEDGEGGERRGQAQARSGGPEIESQRQGQQDAVDARERREAAEDADGDRPAPAMRRAPVLDRRRDRPELENQEERLGDEGRAKDD